MRTSLPICAVFSAAMFLSSCGKQEAVEEVPSSEELARSADTASQAIRDQETGADGDSPSVDTSQMISYTNALRGFTMLVPKDWPADEEASDDDSQLFSDAETGVTLKAGWVKNRDDAELLAAVKALEDAGEGMTGEYVNENEYRASGSIEEGRKTAHRILRKPDGSMVSAVISYPADSAESLDAMATRILDSLTLQ